MSRTFSSSVLALLLLTGACATTPYSVGAAPDRTGLAHYQSGRPTLISRARLGMVEVTPVASEFEDRIVLAVTAINIGAAPVNFGHENVGAVYEDGGAAGLIPVQVLQREARERARVGGLASRGAVFAANYGVDATAIIDTYGRQASPENMGLLRTTTIDSRSMASGLVVLEKPWLNDRVRTLVINVELAGEGHAFRFAIARRGVLLPSAGVAAATRFDTSDGLQTLAYVSPLPARQASRTPSPKPRATTVGQASRQVPKTSPPARLDPYARPRIPRGVIQ